MWTSAREIEFSACCCYCCCCCCLPLAVESVALNQWLVWKSHTNTIMQRSDTQSRQPTGHRHTYIHGQRHTCNSSSVEIANSSQHARTSATFDSEIQSLALVVNATQNIFVARIFIFFRITIKFYSQTVCRQWTKTFLHLIERWLFFKKKKEKPCIHN